MSSAVLHLVAAHLTTAGQMGMARVALPAALDPDPDEARRWVADELAKDDYQDRRSLLQQLVDWLRERLADLQNPRGGGGISLPPFVIGIVAVLLVAVVVVLATRVRRERRTRAASTSVLGGSTLSAAQLRARAAQALAAGRFDEAVLDYTRAIARDADSRTLLTDAPALTAHEIGRQLSEVFPDHAAAVTRATDRFDAVAYGHLAATREHADDVRATDETLRRARPRLPERPRVDEPRPGGSGDSPAPGVVPGEAGTAAPPVFATAGRVDHGPDSVWSSGDGS